MHDTTIEVEITVHYESCPASPADGIPLPTMNIWSAMDDNGETIPRPVFDWLMNRYGQKIEEEIRDSLEEPGDEPDY